MDPAAVVLSQLGEASGAVEDIAGLAPSPPVKSLSVLLTIMLVVFALAWTIGGWS